MSSTTISNLGVGSGLDLSTLYTSLETAEQSKLTTITTQQSSYNSQLSAYGKLQSSMTSLQTATAALTKTTAFNSTTVSSTNTAFTATTDSTANTGSYSVSVTQIAKAQSLLSGSVSSNTAQLGTSGATRTLTITQAGNDTPLSISLADEDTSLTGIANAINKSGGDVSASIIKANDGDYRLMLSSKSTGTDYDMTVSVSGDDALQAVIGYTAGGSSNGMTQQVQSQNAKLTVNGVAIERSSNTITDAPTGVTLQLKAASVSGASEQLEVTRATDDTKAAINAWVKAYNSLQSTIATVTKYTKVETGEDQSTSNGALLGDSNVRSIQSQLRSQLTTVQSGSLAIMAQLGITQDPSIGSDGSTGNLLVDDTKLTAALANNPQGVTDYFIGDGKTTGFATVMNNTLTDMLSTATGKEGVIKNATDGINSTLKTLSQRYDDMSDSIDATMARYKAQFTQLDTLISKLNNTASYLTQQFSTSSS